MIAAVTTATTAAIVTLLSMKDAPPEVSCRWRTALLVGVGGRLGVAELAEVHGQHPDAVDRAAALGERPGGRVVVLGGGVDAEAVAAGLGQGRHDAGEDVRGAVLRQDHKGVAGIGGHAAVTGDPLEAAVVVALEVAVPVQPLGPEAVLGLRVGEEPGREVLEAGPDGDLLVERDDAAAARTLDQHLRGVAGDLAVGDRVEHGAGLDAAVEGQVVDVAVLVGGRVLGAVLGGRGCGVVGGGLGGGGLVVGGGLGGGGLVVGRGGRLGRLAVVDARGGPAGVVGCLLGGGGVRGLL